MRMYSDMIDDYLIWYSKKVNDSSYLPDEFLSGTPDEIKIKKATIWKNILELCYKGNEGVFWFTKFILGDLTYAGYPNKISFNKLWWDWSKLVKKGDHIGITCSRQHGKANPYSTPIITPAGWTTMGQLKIGDKVFSEKGIETTVVNIFEQGVKDVYKITFTDGSTAECELNHLWKVKSGGTGRNGKELKWKIKSLKEIIDERGLNPKSDKAYRIPLTKPVQFKEKTHYIDPYTLGALIGDGGLSQDSCIITSNDIEIVDTIKTNMPQLMITNCNKYSYRLVDYKINHKSTLITELKHLKLWGTKSLTKFIPQEYMVDSVKNRIELLRGLMDTDGCISDTCIMEYYSISEHLCEQVKELVQSLGGKARVDVKNGRYEGKVHKSYRVKIWLQDINPFKLKRKADKFYNIKYKPVRIFKKIELVRQENCRCIMVEDDSHTYLMNDYIVTHNSTYWTVIQSIYRTALFEHYNVLIESASEKQAIMLLGFIVRIIENNEFLRSKKAKSAKWSTTEISYNGGKILGTGVGSEVRGDTMDYIICDDILRSDNKLSDDDIEKFVLEELEPMILVRHGQIVIVGTPKSESDIFSTIKDLIEESENKEGWKMFNYPAILDWDTKELLCPDRFTWEQLMSKRNIMGKMKFDKEFMCSSNSLVVTSRGYIPIKDVVVGDRVKTLSKWYLDVVKTMKRNYKGDMYNIKTYLSNHILDFTPEHPFYIFRNGKYKWIEAKNLIQGDYMVTPIGINNDHSALYLSSYLTTNYTFSYNKNNKMLIKHNNTKLSAEDLDMFYREHERGITPKELAKKYGIKQNTVYSILSKRNKKYKLSIPNNYKFDEDLLRLFGYYLSEGNASTTLNFTFHKNEIYYQNDVIQIIKNKFGLNAKKYFNKNTCQIVVCNKLLCNFFSNFLGKGASNKNIPGIIIHGVKPKILNHLLIGYLRGDGTKIKNGYRFTTVSKRLIENIREISLICGKPCSYAYYKRNNKSIIEGRVINQKDIYVGTIFDKLNKKYGFINNDYLHSRIKKIWTEKVDTMVYNLEIGSLCPDVLLFGIDEDARQSYCTPSGIVHNCETYSSGSQLFPHEIRKTAMDKGSMYKMYSKFKPEEHQHIKYFIGVDCARSGSASGDYTVLTVIAFDVNTQEKRIVWIWRKKGLKTSEQVQQIAEISMFFNHPIILVEQNNMGQDFIDMLIDNFNLNVESFYTSKGSKYEDLIRYLINAFENEKIIMPTGDKFSRDQMKLLNRELERFVVEITKAGNEQYKGSGRSHDDMVISLALANRCSQSCGYSPFATSLPPKHTTDLERYASSGDIMEVLRINDGERNDGRLRTENIENL